MVTCNICNRWFRDNYTVNRHQLKQKKCEKNKPENINNFGNEDLTHIVPDMITEEWKEINKNESESYRRAGKLIIKFHELVNVKPENINIKLKNKRNDSGSIIENNKWKIIVMDDAVNIFVKTRAGQLINKLMNVVIKSDTNKQTLNHVNKFQIYGLAHNETYDNTRTFKTNVKIALIPQQTTKGL